ncbi:MAG: SusD/RagB family nutrient-binding outer membrane lipoprotein, partial [Bacteroidales bacterium]
DGGTAEANCPWGSAQPKVNSWESRENLLNKAIPSEFLCKDMFGDKGRVSSFSGSSDDPRMEMLMAPREGVKGTADPNKKYRYLKNNIGMDVSYKEEKNYPDLYVSPFTQNNGYVPLMMTEELLFMKAEALYWKGDKTAAYEVTKEAVRMNLDRLAPAVSDKVNLNPAVYQKLANEYMTNAKLTAKYLPEANFNIGHLMRQKYIAMMYQPEQWTDMRRYNYSSTKNGITYDGVAVYPTLRRPFNLYEPYWMKKDDQNNVKEEWLQRLNYDPETEEKYNVAELKRLGAYKNPEWLKKPMVWAIYNKAHQ